MQPWQLEAAELARRIAARELSCVEAVRSSLERLEAVNPRINAVVDGGAEEALHPELITLPGAPGNVEELLSHGGMPHGEPRIRVEVL